MKFLFLDFDGVLHSNYGSDAALWTFLPRVEAVLRDFTEVLVVVSSSWGDGRSVDELRGFFSPDIAPRVIDKVRTQLRRMKPQGERGDACAFVDDIGCELGIGWQSTTCHRYSARHIR